MKYTRFVCLSVVLLIAALFGACSDTIGPESPSNASHDLVAVTKTFDASQPTLVGVYDGQYHYTTGFGGPVQDTYAYAVTCKFSGKNYWISNSNYTGTLCESSGQYSVADGVELFQKDDGSPCDDPERNPTGVFDLRQTPNDSLILRQIDGDIMKEFLLVPASSDTAALYVQPMQLDFGADLTELTLAISNHGEGELDYWIAIGGCDWVTGANPQGGTVTTGTTYVTVTVDRTWLPAGDYDCTLYVTSTGGVRFVHVSMTKE